MVLLCGQHGTSDLEKKSVFPNVRLYKKDPSNQYIWLEITDINAKKTYIVICYFVTINSKFGKKCNLDQNCPYNDLEHDISNLNNSSNIMLIGDFNA